MQAAGEGTRQLRDVSDQPVELGQYVTALRRNVPLLLAIVVPLTVLVLAISLTLLGLPFFGLLGFVGAVAGGLWLLRSIWRSNRAGRDFDA